MFIFFVRKIINQSSMRSQIKLRFFNVKNDPMIVVRSMQLTQKQKKSEFKVLDSSISRIDKTTQQVCIFLLYSYTLYPLLSVNLYVIMFVESESEHAWCRDGSSYS